MTNDQKEVLELAKKCGIMQFDIQNEFIALPISINNLCIFAAALEEKHRAKIAMLRNILEHCLDEKRRDLIIVGLDDMIERALSAPQQDTDAFIAEKQATVLEEAAGELLKLNDHVATSCAVKLHMKAANLRASAAQPEVSGQQ